ncbi:MAG TPA: acyl carrier protein [Aestuariivirga sp.]|nr:acyl carrier protein [Aestuariivirga sp.]
MDDRIPVDPDTLRTWMVDYITSVLDLPPETVLPGLKFNEYGLDSVEAVVMAGVLEEEFGVPVDPILLFEHPSIDEFVQARATPGGAAMTVAPDPA